MTHRLLILLAIYFLPLVGGGIALWGWLQLRTFVRDHPSISNQLELDDLKRVVKVDMYLALSVVVIVGFVVILAAFGIYRDLITWSELIGLLALGPICAAAGAKLTATEKQVRSTPLENEALREEFTRVLEAWNSRMLPDW